MDSCILGSACEFTQHKLYIFTHARSGMSLNLPAVFLFIIIIFCVAIVHFRFIALAPLFPRSTQYLFDFRFLRMT